MAEGMGFEPMGPVRSTAFQAVPLDHSGTLPHLANLEVAPFWVRPSNQLNDFENYTLFILLNRTLPYKIANV